MLFQLRTLYGANVPVPKYFVAVERPMSNTSGERVVPLFAFAASISSCDEPSGFVESSFTP